MRSLYEDYHIHFYKFHNKFYDSFFVKNLEFSYNGLDTKPLTFETIKGKSLYFIENPKIPIRKKDLKNKRLESFQSVFQQILEFDD
jgi:hypothetical protein